MARTLDDIVEELKQTESVLLSVRQLLRLYGAKRRGYWIVRSIREDLERRGIESTPDFDQVYIDRHISLRKKAVTQEEHSEHEMAGVEDVSESHAITESGEVLSAVVEDATFRIGRMPSLENQLTSLTPDSPLREAMTIMGLNDFSQLPVMTTKRTVKGIITWESIAKTLAFEKDANLAREAMVEAKVISSEASLFDALPWIAEFGYVLVRSDEGVVEGIVTSGDMALQFRELSEPFLLLGEIENHLRQLLDTKLGLVKIKAALEPDRNTSDIVSVNDLTFGDYCRVLERPECWEQCAPQVDRQIFTRSINEVRDLRNEIMHFSPDPLDQEDIQLLRRTSSYLRDMRRMIGF